jgi:hypothetical protein
MKQSELQIELNKFRDYVVSQAKANLTRGGKNSSKSLYNSIKGNVKANPNSFEMDFSMEEYGFYQDKGVSGIKKKYNTDYKYTNKMPPAKAFDKWVVRKGLAPREKGKFKNRKSLSFAIARSVYYNGIKPSLFFTKPFEKAFKRLPEDLVEAFGLDAIKLFNTTTFPKQK